MIVQSVRFNSKILCDLVFGLLLVSCITAPSPAQSPTPQIASPIALSTITSNPPAAGDLDPTFGRGGIVITNPLCAGLTALAIQADGKAVVAATEPCTPIPDYPSGIVLHRYNLDGSPDSTFGKDWLVYAPFPTDARAGAVTIQFDGKIVVVGTVRNDGPGWDDFALARYNTDGSLDATFGTHGTVVTDLSGGNDWGQAAAIQADGRIIAAGRTTGAPGHPDTLALARYRPDGTLDDTFGTSGIVFVEMNRHGDARAVAVQADGKVVVAGSGNSQVRMFNFAVLRFNADGELDSTFGSDGIVLTDLGANATAMAIAIQPDGKIVAAGQAVYKDKGSFLVARYNTDGTLDPTFAETGLANSNLSGVGWARGVAIQRDGKIVAAGGTGKTAYASSFAVLRYDTNGTLDRTFGRGGQVITALDGAIPIGMGLQPDGKIVVAGYAISYLTPPGPVPWRATSESSLLLRYLP